MSQEINSCYKKLILVRRIHFLWLRLTINLLHCRNATKNLVWANKFRGYLVVRCPVYSLPCLWLSLFLDYGSYFTATELGTLMANSNAGPAGIIVERPDNIKIIKTSENFKDLFVFRNKLSKMLFLDLNLLCSFKYMM